MVQIFHGRFDLILSCEEAKDITLPLCDVNLQDGHDRRLDIVSLRVRGIVDIDGKPSSGNLDDRCSIEILGELFGFQRSRRNYYLQLGPLNRQILDEGDQDIGVHRSFVGFIDYNYGVGFQIGLEHELSQHHTVGHVLYYCGFAGVVFETDRVAHLLA